MSEPEPRDVSVAGVRGDRGWGGVCGMLVHVHHPHCDARDPRSSERVGEGRRAEERRAVLYAHESLHVVSTLLAPTRTSSW
jgi:hypothetical protein